MPNARNANLLQQKNVQITCDPLTITGSDTTTKNSTKQYTSADCCGEVQWTVSGKQWVRAARQGVAPVDLPSTSRSSTTERRRGSTPTESRSTSRTRLTRDDEQLRALPRRRARPVAELRAPVHRGDRRAVARASPGTPLCRRASTSATPTLCCSSTSTPTTTGSSSTISRERRPRLAPAGRTVDRDRPALTPVRRGRRSPPSCDRTGFELPETSSRSVRRSRGSAAEIAST